MFLENTVNPKEQIRWIEVICGSMSLARRGTDPRFKKEKPICQAKWKYLKPMVGQKIPLRDGGVPRCETKLDPPRYSRRQIFGTLGSRLRRGGNR